MRASPETSEPQRFGMRGRQSASEALSQALRWRLAAAETRLLLLRSGVASQGLPPASNGPPRDLPCQRLLGNPLQGIRGQLQLGWRVLRRSAQKELKGQLQSWRRSGLRRAVLCVLLLAQTMSVSGSGLVGLHLQSYRQAGTHCPSHSTPSRKRHNDAGQGGALPFARLDQSRFHPISDAADHVDPAAHPLKRYDVLRAIPS